MKELKHFTLTHFIHRLAAVEQFTRKHVVERGRFRHYNQMQFSSYAIAEDKTKTTLQIARTRFGFDIAKGNELMQMYFKTGNVMNARQVFDKMPERNIISWNLMMKGYARQGLGEEALQLFLRLQSELGTKPDSFAFVNTIRVCILLSDIELGKQVHVHTVKTGFELDVFVGCVLVEMYAKWEIFDSSLKVFNKMHVRDIFSWNTLIAGYARHCYLENALKLFCQLREESMEPDEFCFGNILGVCASLAAVEECTQLHAQVIKFGFDSDVFVGSNLVDSYAKSGNLEVARKVFDEMHNRDIITWTMMISGYAQNRQSEEAFELFLHMRLMAVRLNQFTFTSLLSAFVTSEALNLGKRVHTHIMKTGFGLDLSVGNALVTMYCKCSSTEDARQCFDRMSKRDVVSWTAMIAGYAWNGYGAKALSLFRETYGVGMDLNQFALTSILSTFVGREFIEQGKQLHSVSIKTGFQSYVSVENALLSMYAKCGDMNSACRVFDEIKQRDAVSWNAMIAAYVQNGQSELALKLFSKMQQATMESNQFTFASILEACGTLTAMEESKQVHAHVIKCGFQSDTSMNIGLIDVYANCRKIDDAQKLFNKIPKQNVISWNAMIGGYVQNDHGEEAFKMFCEMQGVGIEPNQSTCASVLRACANLTSMEQGKQLHVVIIKTGYESDVFVGSALVDMYAKCGNIEDAHVLFGKMPERNVVTWNVIITGYAQHGFGEEVLMLFEQMQEEGLKPNDITFIGVLYACCHAGLVAEGCQYFDSMSEDHGIAPRLEHFACIIDLLGRSGHLDKAGELIKQMPFEPDALIWQIFLGACRIHRNVELGKHAAEYLLESQPQNASTYVLLSNIYAVARRWDDVKKLRKIMKDKDVKKDPGCSWIEVKRRVHSFVVEDRAHPQTGEIYAKLEELHRQMLDAGYVPDTSFVLQDVDQDYKEEILFHQYCLAP